MSLESFVGFDTGEGGSEAAFEAFKEKMKRAAAQIAAIQKEEKKQKKKEDELVKILLQFIKSSHKKELVLLISRVLEQNLPANFILAIIILGNEEIQRATGSYLLLKDTPEAKEQALAFFGKDESLPLKIRIQLDTWLKAIMHQAGEAPHKLIKTAYDRSEDDKKVKVVLVQLMAFIMQDFLAQHDVDESIKKLRKFTEFILKGLLQKIEETIEKRGLLKS